MAKLRLYSCLVLLLLFSGSIKAFSQYRLKISCVDKDSLFTQKNLGLPSSFKNKNSCIDYVSQLPAFLQAKGFATVSIDSTRFDSLEAFIQLYIGDRFKWAAIHTQPTDAVILGNIGWDQKKFINKPLDFHSIQLTEQRLLDWLENNGYPFARISLDSVFLQDGELTAQLKIEKGPLYRIDSIRIYGTAKISKDFLQHYLNLPDGSIYKKEKLEGISKKIRDLPYIQEQQYWTLTLLGTGSVLNLYLKPKRSSQIDVLLGFLPNNNQLVSKKLLVTGEATINLKNTLGNGESIGLNWQQIQVQSPRLNLYFQQPFLFRSPLGLNLSFDLLKKDSSYLNINALLGIQYSASAARSGSVFIQSSSSNLLTVDTLQVIATHRLPVEADLSSINLGLSYEFNNTNYRFNPLRGNELQFVGTVGTRKIHKNSQIVKLTDPTDANFSFNSLYDSVKLNSYEFRVKLIAAHYFQLTRVSTLKAGIHAAVFQSPNTYRNEAFQIGGYRLLRGFDEESIVASQYAVATLEYRFLIAPNSFLFSFVDWGWAESKIPGYSVNNSFLGFGLGLAFETKAGIFNISYALGKRDDSNLNLRQAKIHLGYLNFF